MDCGHQEWRGPLKPEGIWTWGMVGSLVLHGLLAAGIVAAYHERPSRSRVVVPVEAISLASPGPRGGGGRPAPATRPQPAAPRSKPPAPAPPKPRIKPKPPQVRPAPLPEPAKAPVIPLPAPASAPAKAKPSLTASLGSRTGAPGTGTGVGAAGGGGGPGSGSGPGVGSGQGSGAGSGVALQGYLRTIRQLLEKQKDYPQMARRRNLQGVVVVTFTISASGQIESAQVTNPSGHDLLDEGARNTIKRVGRFPPFPAGLNRQELTLKIPLAFRLTHD